MTTELNIDRDIYISIKEQICEAYPTEACGVLLGDARGHVVSRIIPLENITKDKSREHFFVDPRAFYKAELEAEEMGLAIIGTYHSHPDCEAVLSAEDERYMIPQMISLIIPVKQKEAGRGRAYMKLQVEARAAEIGIHLAGSEQTT